MFCFVIFFPQCCVCILSFMPFCGSSFFFFYKFFHSLPPPPQPQRDQLVRPLRMLAKSMVFSTFQVVLALIWVQKSFRGCQEPSGISWIAILLPRPTKLWPHGRLSDPDFGKTDRAACRLIAPGRKALAKQEAGLHRDCGATLRLRGHISD